jgi:hypothetical protein
MSLSYWISARSKCRSLVVLIVLGIGKKLKKRLRVLNNFLKNWRKPLTLKELELIKGILDGYYDKFFETRDIVGAQEIVDREIRLKTTDFVTMRKIEK